VPESITPAAGPPRPTAFWHALTVAWAIPAAVMSASFSPHPGLVFAVLALGGIMGLAWSFQALRVLLDREALGRLTPRAVAGWAAYPVTGLLLLGLSWSQWPLALRVRLSEPDLRRLAEGVEDGWVQVDRRVGAGLVLVEHAEARADCVMLCTGHGLFLTDIGIAYSRDGDGPSPVGQCRFRHLFGRWHTYRLKL
jgi:hypothetical protein